MGVAFETRFDRGLPVMARGMDPNKGEGLDVYLNRVHQAIDTSHEKAANGDDLLLVAYREGSEIKLKVMEAESDDADNHGGKSVHRYPRQALLDAMGTKTSRGVLTPDMIALLDPLQKDKDTGKRTWYNWAMALGLSLAMADAMWQAGCFMLSSMTGDAEHGFGALTHAEIWMFTFPIALALIAGGAFYKFLIHQYKRETGSDTVPDHIEQACAKQGRQLAAKMFAAVATFTAVEYALKYNAVQNWLENNVILSDVSANIAGTSIEMAFIMSFIIGAMSALAVVGTAMIQDKADHGKLTAGASFYLALAASVIAGVVSWCFMASFGFDTSVDAAFSNKGAYIIATLGTLALVTAAFKALPMFQDGYDKVFAFPAKTHLALMAGFAALTVACAIVGFSLAAFPMDMGGSDFNLLDSIFSSGLDKAVGDPSAGESAGLGVASVVSFFGMGASGYAANKQCQAAKEEIAQHNKHAPA